MHNFRRKLDSDHIFGTIWNLFGHFTKIYAAQAQSDQLISAQSRSLQTQNEIPKFSIHQTILNFVKLCKSFTSQIYFWRKNQFIWYSYQNQSLQQIPMLVTVFLQVIKKLFYQTISLLTTFFQVMIKF